MEWVRGDRIGHGSFGTVNLAIPRSQSPRIPPLMAVKSCGVSHSASLMNEKLILADLGDRCAEIIGCFGDSFSFENGEKLYNVLLEYASGGALADKVKNSLPESDVRRYANSILRGLHCIHKNGYVHCDIKLQNVLVFCSKTGGNDAVKIADFGLAKKSGVKGSRHEVRGTPMYMSPEMVAGGEQESPADIWAFGCLVAEMVTGAPAWRCKAESDVAGLFMRIGVGEEVPEIPGNLSEEGKDFLGKCFLKDPRERWTAEMLLNHPFVADHDDTDDDYDTNPLKHTEEAPWISPRGPFDFPTCLSEQSSLSCSITTLSSPQSESWFHGEMISRGGSSSISPAGRIRRLVSHQRPDCSFSEDWVTVR